MSRRHSTLCASLLCSVAAISISVAATPASAQEARFNIPAQPLASALNAFSEQSDRAVIFKPDLASAKRTQGVSGPRDVSLALTQLLAGTGLTYQRDGDAFVIVADKAASGPQSESAGPGAEPTRVDEVIVTAQKKEERIQDVPISISAFSSEALDAQKIEGGYDLLKAVPNVTFSKSNYSSYNFAIRGVGTKAVSATSDPGVAVSYNNVSLLRNRLYEQEYFDVERVEVLRGPQGTLYGRNATGGVVNMITAKPKTGLFEAEVKGEVGNYDSRRMSAMVNVPVGDMLAIRFAASGTQRSGYGVNLTTGDDVDNRDMWSSRLSIGFEPNDRIRANFVWEHFDEDDARLRTGKQLCHRDDGPEFVDGVTGPLDMYGRGKLSQGCKIGSLYSADAYGKPNGWSLPFTFIMSTDLANLGYDKPVGDPTRALVPLMIRGQDPYGGGMQSRDLRAIEMIVKPEYRAKADIFALNLDVDLTDSLTFSSQTLYNEDSVYSLQDYMRFSTVPAFTDTNLAYADGLGPNGQGTVPGVGLRVNLPGGMYCDPQIGCSNTLKGFEVSSSESTQFSQELRLQSSFDGPVNFSVGANYLRFRGVNDYYLFFNVLSLMAEQYYNSGKPYNPSAGNMVYVDHNSLENVEGDGHNYFRNQNPYKLDSAAAFGEFYWQATDALKITAGLRYTNDRKTFTPWPSHLLVQNLLNSQYGPEADIKQDWQEFTGRLGIDWKPDLSFTDQTMVYAFYSRGYKGGGMNPPPAKNPQPFLQAVTPATFDPEYVNAFEIGAKNTLLGGTLTLNGSAFYYDYKDYQVSKVVDRTIANEGFDATMWGAELEALWRPINNLRLNANLGYLKSKIGDGEYSLDIFNRTQGQDGWMVVTPFPQQTSNCVLPTAYVAQQIMDYRAMYSPVDHARYGGDGGGLMTACLNFWMDPSWTTPSPNVALYPEANAGQGFLADVSGNELPNAPRWTISLGAEYTVNLPGGWEGTIRGDYYRQADSWARVYGEVSDRLEGWQNANLSLTFARPEDDLTVQLYAKNIFDETPITDAFLNSDSTGMTTNVFTLDPRLIGLSIRKGF
jgi:iron complex outermembrane receptor protein